MVVEVFHRAKRPEPYSSLLSLDTGAFCWVPEMLGFGFTALSSNVGSDDLKEPMDVMQKCEP